MPPIRPCIQHRCTEYALPRKSRCQKHHAEFEAKRRKDPNLTGRRGSTRKWRFLRRLALRRADYRCEQCGKPAIAGVRALEVHHRDGNARNDKPENLQVLCVELDGPGGCHRAQPAQKERRAAGSGQVR